MLDAAHGDSVSPNIVVQREHASRMEAQIARTGASRHGCGRPIVAIRADDIQGSRRVGAVARSRRMEHSLE